MTKIELISIFTCYSISKIVYNNLFFHLQQYNNMVLITIDRLLYKITDKDYKELKQIENDTTSHHKEYHDNIENCLAKITLKYTAFNVVEGNYILVNY